MWDIAVELTPPPFHVKLSLPVYIKLTTGKVACRVDKRGPHVATVDMEGRCAVLVDLHAGEHKARRSLSNCVADASREVLVAPGGSRGSDASSKGFDEANACAQIFALLPCLVRGMVQ